MWDKNYNIESMWALHKQSKMCKVGCEMEKVKSSSAMWNSHKIEPRHLICRFIDNGQARRRFITSKIKKGKYGK